MVDKNDLPLSQRKWLVTGGCGFIGKTLVKALVDNKEASLIRVFDNLSVGSRQDLAEYCDFAEISLTDGTTSPKISDNGKPNVELVVGDIRDADAAFRVCAGMDVIAHLAANTGVGPSVDNPRQDMESNNDVSYL